MIWKTIIFWLAVLLLLDAGLALFFLGSWQKRLPGLNIKLIAAIEVALAAVLLALYYLWRV